ncbi:hypothetical protein [Nonomuraea sp. CA-141351]|uniref:hypothetical protein n=1 Tax=Nonomuraea sp. CA-141351 TaxID=3239996 RepID=UPI003D9294B2
MRRALDAREVVGDPELQSGMAAQAGNFLEVKSPDKTRAVFRRGHDLWVRSPADDRERQVTIDGEKDHVAATRQPAERRPWMDLDRGVAVCGMPGGGFATVRAMLDFPGVYTVGAAICGSHWRRRDVRRAAAGGRLRRLLQRQGRRLIIPGADHLSSATSATCRGGCGITWSATTWAPSRPHQADPRSTRTSSPDCSADPRS